MYEFKTDSVLYRPLKRKRTNVLEALTFPFSKVCATATRTSPPRLGGSMSTAPGHRLILTMPSSWSLLPRRMTL